MSNSGLHIIIGLGATGLACARYLQARGIPFAINDSRPNPPNLEAFKHDFPGVQVVVGGLDKAFLSKAATIVISPGMPVSDPVITELLQQGVAVIGDIELFAREVNRSQKPVIAITGTNAKSTVTTLVGLMAQAAGYQTAVGGNLGEPALDLILKNPDADLYVLELSSFQLETTYSLEAKVATVLNITPDHMDRYVDLAHYQQAKHRIYQHCAVAVCNRDDALTYTQAPRVIYFTMNVPQENEFGLLVQNNETFLAYGDKPLLSIRELPVIGKHYQANALAALAIGYAYGIGFEPMLQVLREFAGLPHRCQFVRERNGVRWYNDSKGTNVGATQAAIEGLGSEINGKLVLIAGGLGKNADFSPMVPIIEKYSRHVVLIGEAAQELARLIDGRVPFSHAQTMAEAVQQCAEKALPGDSVLLSPACASYDMFKHFAHRGDVFMEVVAQL